MYRLRAILVYSLYSLETSVKKLTSRKKHFYEEVMEFYVVRVCVCVCVVIPFILDVRLMDVPAGVTQEEGHTGFLHLPSAVLALTFLARRVQPFLSLVNREVEFGVLTNYLSFSTCSAFSILFLFLWEKIPVCTYSLGLNGAQLTWTNKKY